MNKIKKMMAQYPARFAAILFAVGAILVNTLWVSFFNTLHIYDVIHVVPTALLQRQSEVVIIVVVALIDAIIGLGIGKWIGRLTKHPESYGLALFIVWLIYTIVITYQWIPII